VLDALREASRTGTAVDVHVPAPGAKSPS
jgi:hypothetical protein